jgi:hypothetical protein
MRISVEFFKNGEKSDFQNLKNLKPDTYIPLLPRRTWRERILLTNFVDVQIIITMSSQPINDQTYRS